MLKVLNSGEGVRCRKMGAALVVGRSGRLKYRARLSLGGLSYERAFAVPGVRGMAPEYLAHERYAYAATTNASVVGRRETDVHPPEGDIAVPHIHVCVRKNKRLFRDPLMVLAGWLTHPPR